MPRVAIAPCWRQTRTFPSRAASRFSESSERPDEVHEERLVAHGNGGRRQLWRSTARHRLRAPLTTMRRQVAHTTAEHRYRHSPCGRDRRTVRRRGAGRRADRHVLLHADGTPSPSPCRASWNACGRWTDAGLHAPQRGSTVRLIPPPQVPKQWSTNEREQRPGRGCGTRIEWRTITKLRIAVLQRRVHMCLDRLRRRRSCGDMGAHTGCRATRRRLVGRRHRALDSVRELRRQVGGRSRPFRPVCGPRHRVVYVICEVGERRRGH